MLAVFFLILELGIGFLNQSVLANASRAAVREAVRGRTNEQAREAAERIVKNGIAADVVNPEGFLPMISWTDDAGDTSDDIRVVLACPPTTLNEGQVGVCIQRNDEFDATFSGVIPEWIRATVYFDYELPGLSIFLPDALSEITLTATTTMRSFQE
jgi:Flp pilus assembly protein TadG